MAAGILLGVVMAVTSAITAGQHHSVEAQKRIAGALAAEELLSRLVTVSYDKLATWNGYVEAIGTLTDTTGDAMPPLFDSVGRSVTVTTELREFPELGVNIRGRTIVVQAVDAEAQVLAELTHFVPEPAADSIVEEEEGGLLGELGGALLGGGK
jgi:hypothetical protein